MKSLQLLALSTLLCTGLALAQTTPTTTTAPGSTTAKPAKPATTSAPATTAKPAAKTATPKAPAPPPPSAADIAGAKAKGLVWVNMNTKVYHAAGDKEYGTTKNGKFMTVADAKAAGARVAKN